MFAYYAVDLPAALPIICPYIDAIAADVCWICDCTTVCVSEIFHPSTHCISPRKITTQALKENHIILTLYWIFV